MKVSRDWDAETYERVSIPHEDWANATLDRLDLRGDETVLDAGCGSGRVTGLVIERVPRGRVVAVDGSASMIEAVGGVLRPGDRAIHSDLTALELEDEVDAAFSSAVFHWIADHDLLFARLHAALRPGGRLAAQCGGAGNIETFRRAGEEVATREPYAPYFDDFDRPWNYATAEETEERLRRAGFERVRCWLEPWSVTPPEPRAFVATVCLGAHQERRPEERREPYYDQILALEGKPLKLDYVRLNIDAVAA